MCSLRPDAADQHLRSSGRLSRHFMRMECCCPCCGSSCAAAGTLNSPLSSQGHALDRQEGLFLMQVLLYRICPGRQWGPLWA